jgi:hypothetical protein
MRLRLIVGVLALAQLVPSSRGWGAEPPEVRYRLHARVNDSTGIVDGRAEIRYRHRGPDTLRTLALALRYNAFRPGASDWPSKALAGADQTGYLRVYDLRLDGAPAAVEWPGSPDSSRGSVHLVRSLGPGDSVVLAFGWNGRPPALDWHRERRARRIDLAGWYPQIIDATSGTSVPFPAFATVLLTIDLAADQVIGGTGVPLCGDPGWTGAAAATTRIDLQRDWYRTPVDSRAPGVSCGGASPGEKRIVWYAEGVTGVGYALSPAFVYEEGDFLGQPVHVLYERGVERVWGAGLASRRAETAMAWVAELGGLREVDGPNPYPWPHLTVVQGVDQGSRAEPMVLLSNMPSQTALLELLGLMSTQHVMGGGAPVFTVGTAAFQTSWFYEAIGRRGDYTRIEREILDWDLDRLGLRDEPLGPSASGSPCISTSCRRFELVSHQLRRWAGNDQALRQLYRTLYDRFKLRPTVPGVFQELARATITPTPDSLYVQLSRGGTLYDDAVMSADREPMEQGGWRTTAVLERRGAGIFPRMVWVVADSDTVVTRAASLAARETVTTLTRSRPRRVVLDPLAESHDWNMLNNQRSFGFRAGWLRLAPNRPTRTYLDTYFTRRTARDHVTLGWVPTIWYNDAGGWTLGLRFREDYLGRFELNQLWVSAGTGWDSERGRARLNGRLVLRNPVLLRAAGWSQELQLAAEEGRTMVRAGAERRFRAAVADSTWRSLGVAAHWLTVTDPRYLDSREYDDAGTAELTVTGRVARSAGRVPFRLETALSAGYGYPNQGSAIGSGGYGRLVMEASARIPLGKVLAGQVRLFAGVIGSADSAPRQRRIPIAGGDPYSRFDSPFLRSTGSLLAGSGFFYHFPGGAGIRGLDPRVSGEQALGATAEFEYAVARPAVGERLPRIAIAVFGDGALARGGLDSGRVRLHSVGDAGVGVRVRHRIGGTRFMTRFDFPVWVSRPNLAQDDHPDHRFGFRWAVSFAPAAAGW